MFMPQRDKTNDIVDSFYEELERDFDKYSHVDILFGDFSSKVGRKGIFKTTVGK
jgi:hypothetical protein